MSIRKKLLILVSLIVITPMVILFVSSTVIMNSQKKDSELRYLQSAMKIVRTQMLSRKDEMERGGKRIATNEGFQAMVQAQDVAVLTKELQKLKQVFDYLDVAVVLDKDRNPMALISKDLQAEVKWDLNGLVQAASAQRKAISSEETLLLTELFYPDSVEYTRFKIPIANRLDKNGEQVYLTQCQIGLAVVPIMAGGNPEQVLGYLVLGDIVNNDPYFPTMCSRSVEGSYLALSIDNIRISSNIQTPTKENYIGSLIPVTTATWEGPKQHIFGRVDFNDEVHVFLDEAIINHKGEPIATIGIGIPEERFAQILSTNQYLIVAVTMLCLSIMLGIGRYFAEVITEPIVVATQFAEQLANGERNLILKPEWIKDQKSETTILLTTFQKMASSLEASEKQSETYLEKLQQEHLMQIELSNQLKLMNDELEGKVAARTVDLVQAIAELKKADGVKSRFLANMSHELRTPLSAIISSAEALIGRIFGPLTEKQEKHIQNALHSGKHLLQLINDILDICKIEAGKMNLTLSEFYVSEIIKNSCAVVRSIADHKNIEMTVKIEPSDFKIKADATKFKQILYNLLSNAVKFTLENGKIEIGVYKQGKILQARIRDNGIGIKEEDQERVFLEFEQVDNSDQRLYEGTGLGLPLTKKLVEMHGGQIFMISKEGVGTEIVFTLPIDAVEVSSDNNASSRRNA
jgi:signal transduction histidine kinase